MCSFGGVGVITHLCDHNEIKRRIFDEFSSAGSPRQQSMCYCKNVRFPRFVRLFFLW